MTESIARQNERPLRERIRNPSAVAEQIRVLLVDDEEDQFALIRSLLRPFGSPSFSITWAASHGAGLQRLTAEQFDACLVDYRLGLMDGVTFIREAKNGGCRLPFILVTGKGGRDVDLEAMRAGAIDFVAKARLDGAILERAIRYAINQASLVDALERSRDELSALDEAARILAADGPTSQAVGRIVEIIADRLRYAAVATYLMSGDRLRLVAARGFTDPAPTLSASSGAVGRVLAKGQPAIIPEWCDDADERIEAGHAALVVPLVAGDRADGLITVTSSKERPIDEREHRAVIGIANTVAAALVQYEATASLRQRADALERLRAFDEQVPLGVDPADFLPSLLTNVEDVIHADGAALAQPATGESTLTIVAARGSLHGRLGSAMAEPSGPISRARATGLVQIDTSTTSCYAFVPLIRQHQSLGMLWLERRGLAAEFTPTETWALEMLGSRVALAVLSTESRHRTAGLTDAATGLYTRAVLDEWLLTPGPLLPVIEENVAAILVGPREPAMVSSGAGGEFVAALARTAREIGTRERDVLVRYDATTLAIVLQGAASSRIESLARAMSMTRGAAAGAAVAVGWARRDAGETAALLPAAEMALELARRTHDGVVGG